MSLSYGTVCEHGQLARSCNICELEQERDQLKAELEKWKEDANRLAITSEVVNFCLERYGPSIVPHLMDTDQNAGQRMREALAAHERMVKG